MSRIQEVSGLRGDHIVVGAKERISIIRRQREGFRYGLDGTHHKTMSKCKMRDDLSPWPSLP